MTDDSASNGQFYWIEAALLSAPLFAYLGTGVKLWLRPKPFAYFLALCLFLICVATFFNFSNWRFRSDLADVIVGDLGYLAAVSAPSSLTSLTKNKGLRWALRGLCSIPVVLGLLLGTVGILGLMFTIDDNVPRQEARLNSEYGFRVRFTGNALASTHSAELEIVKYPRFLPIQKVVLRRSFDRHEYNYRDGLRVVLTPDGRQVVVTLLKVGGGQAVEHLDLQ